MAEHVRTGTPRHDGRRGSLGELIHVAVRRAIEVAVLGLTLPRATLFSAMDPREWTSALVPRYQRRM